MRFGFTVCSGGAFVLLEHEVHISLCDRYVDTRLDPDIAIPES